MSVLTSEQIEFFHQNGYIAIGKLLEAEHIEILRREYDREFEAARKNNRFRNLAISNTDDLSEKTTRPTQMLQIMQMCERNLHYRELIYYDPILDIAEALIGPNIQLFHDQALFKPAHTGMRFFGIKTMDTGNVCLPSRLMLAHS